MNNNQKHVHFIGICGVAMSALAILMQKKGWKVTGSDKGFYPPISTHLLKNKIEFYPGWHIDKIGKPDLVVVGNVAGSTNPEFLFIQENNIPYVSYPELIAQELLKENNIVIAGTYGKTSCTCLLSWILKKSNYKPSYMFGGLSNNLELSADDLGGQYSVLEGDEYKTSRWDKKAKFFSYKPTHLLLTAVKWDHADVYKTEQSYFNAFEKLVKMVPKEGLIVASENVLPEILKQVQDDSECVQNDTKIITYGKNDNCDYQYSNVESTQTGLKLTIKHKNQTYNIKTPILGDFQAENVCGSFTMAHQIGIKTELITELITEFKGIKRRLEIKGKTKNNVVVIDDIAHSPDKAKSVLETLKNIYTGKITCVFEPNTGNRNIESIPSYDNAFKSADEVVIPKLTKVKIKNGDPNPPFDGEKLTEIISKIHSNTKYIENDEKLLKYLTSNTSKGDVIVFCGSHSFRGMIDELIKQPQCHSLEGGNLKSGIIILDPRLREDDNLI